VRPQLLYVTPVRPARTGNGLAMRAWNVLEALATHYRVHLHVVPLYAPSADLTPELQALCEEIVEAPTPLAFPDRRFDVVHALRLAVLPFARAAAGEARHVDLDDVEPKTYRRLAALHRLVGDGERAEAMEREALRYEPLEEEALESWDRVYVCSEPDRDELAARARAEVRVLPNVVAVPPAVAPPGGGGPFRLLFVGNLGYFPNQDGVRWLCDEVLPELRAAAPAPFRVVAVGGGWDDPPRAPELELAGAVPDVGPWYRDADAAVVPLRAGGGTRIKILEAFAHGVPVVSTPLGAEGLAVEDGTHLLVAEDPEGFARRCAELMERPALADGLRDRARRLVAESYSPGAAAAAVAPSAARPR